MLLRQQSIRILFATCLYLALCTSLLCAQQIEDVVHGEIEFSEEVEKKITYDDIQNEVLSEIENLLAFVSDPSVHREEKTFSLSENSLSYLNSFYLYFAVNRGTYAAALNAILEMDIINSVYKGEAACLNLRRFWKMWIDTDMQERHRYQVRTTYLRTTDKFKKEQLPKYLRCTKTVQQAITTADTKSPVDFFTERYASENLRFDLEQIRKDIQLLVKKDINVFYAAGTKS